MHMLFSLSNCEPFTHKHKEESSEEWTVHDSIQSLWCLWSQRMLAYVSVFSNSVQVAEAMRSVFMMDQSPFANVVTLGEMG